MNSLASQDSVLYGTIEASSATVLLSKLDSEPYTTIYPVVMDNLVPNDSVGIQRVRDSYGLEEGNIDFSLFSLNPFAKKYVHEIVHVPPQDNQYINLTT